MDPFKYLVEAGRADTALLRKTYLALAKKLHPDVDADDPEANRRMQELNAYYEAALKRAEDAPSVPQESVDPAPAEKKIRTLVLHFSSVVDDYLRNVPRSTSLSAAVRESLERVAVNLSYLEAEKPATPVHGLATAFREYAADPAHLAFLSDPKSRKERAALADLRREANLLLRDLFLENRRLFVRSELKELAVFFAGRLRNLTAQARAVREEEGRSVLGLCEALRLSFVVVLPSLKEHHRKSLIV